MAKKHRGKRRKKSGLFGSQRGGVPKGMFVHAGQRLLNGAEGVATAKVSQFLISKLPIASPKIKASLQVALGLFGGLFTDSKPMLKGLSDGPYYIGLSSLAKSLGVETMAGEEDYHVAVDKNGNLHEVTTAELQEMQGGGDDKAFSLHGNFDGNFDGDGDDDGEGMGEDFPMK